MSPQLIGWLAKLLAIFGLVAMGWRFGAQHTQGAWDAAELQRERGAQILAAQDRHRAAQAGAQYEAQAAQRRITLAKVLPEARHELQRPISCPAGQSLQLDSLPVPAAVLERLRVAGADQSPY